MQHQQQHQLLDEEHEKQQDQQQQQPSAATQPGPSWIYTRVPESRLNACAIIQIIIVFFYNIVNIFASNNISILCHAWSLLVTTEQDNYISNQFCAQMPLKTLI
jgi:hypothetical protein